MKRRQWIIFFTMALLFSACTDNAVTKTLYGTWNPILEAPENDPIWVPSTENYLITVSGKCEEIEVTKTQKGDLTNADVPMSDAKCYGNRDQLSFRDTLYLDIHYDLKLDASKDTLVGTMTVFEDGKPTPNPYRIKLLRI
jgi:hypothetical protein